MFSLLKLHLRNLCLFTVSSLYSWTGTSGTDGITEIGFTLLAIITKQTKAPDRIDEATVSCPEQQAIQDSRPEKAETNKVKPIIICTSLQPGESSRLPG